MEMKNTTKTMKIFQLNQQFLMKLGIIRPQSSAQKYPFNAQNLRCIFIYGAGVISCGYYFFYQSDTFMAHIFSVFLLFTMIISLMIYTYIVWIMPEFFKFIRSTEEIIQGKLKSNCIKTDRQVEKWCKIIHFLFMKLLMPAFMLPRFIASTSAYFMTDFGNDALELPFPMAFPFNSKSTPIAYILAFILEYILFSYNFLLALCLVCFGIGSYLYAITLAKFLGNALYHINKNAKVKKHQSAAASNLCDFIQLQTDGKRPIEIFLDIYQPIITILFLWSMGTLCGSMLMFRMGIRDNSLILLAVSLVQLGWSTGLTLIPCELGERFSISYVKVCNAIDEFDWYAFPIDMQKALPIILINAQKPIALKCFGSIVCGRQVFKKMYNTAFSWYMVLREFSE